MTMILMATVAAAFIFLALNQANAADFVPKDGLGLYISVIAGASSSRDVRTDAVHTTMHSILKPLCSWRCDWCKGH
jgi:hypothetical protein